MKNSRGIAAAILILVSAALTTAAANPSKGNSGDTPSTEVYTVKGWSDFGPTEETVTETINPDGTGSAELSGVVSTLSPAAARQRAARSTGPEATEADVEAWVLDPSQKGGPEPTSDGVVANPKSSRATGHRNAAAAAAAANGGLPAYHCAEANVSDNDVHYRVCTTYTFKGKSNGNTYFTGKGVGSAWSTDSGCLDCDRIEKFAAWSDLSNAQGTVFSWAPETTSSVGSSCHDVTTSTSATRGGLTMGATETETVCPEKFGAYGPALTSSSSGSYWAKAGADTVPKDETRGAHFVQLDEWDRSEGTLLLASHGTVWWD